MCKQLIYLVSFVLVLALALTSVVEAADPNPVGWWKLDDGSGTIASDSSGNGNDGTFNGDPQWVVGHLGGALEFDGDDHVDCGNDPSLDITAPITIMIWARPSVVGETHTTNPGVIAKAESGVAVWSWQLRYKAVGSPGYMGFQFNSVAGGSVWTHVGQNLEVGEWYHIAGVADGTSAICYLNGQETDRQPLVDFQSSDSKLFIGYEGWVPWYGAADDARIYDFAMTEDEIQQAMKGIPLGSASNPGPDSGATDVPRDVALSWEPGEFAAPTNGHKVYFGESFNDVNDATGGVAQSVASYTPPRLDFGTTYYWRVDEVNAPPTSHIEFKGGVWSFTTEPIGYPVPSENITATASSAHQADMGPENTINGSGLDADDLHSIEPVDMWLSGDEPNGAWIEYELDKVHKLHEMQVWNSNGMMESFLGFGLKDVTIEYSVDGNDYMTLGTTHEFARAPGTPDYTHNTTVDLSGVTAKYVRLTTNRNWGGFMLQYGLSEVRFFSIPVFAREPNPDSGTTDVAVDVTLGFRAGREAVTHDVYLSTDEQVVIDGNAPVTTVTENSYGPLLLDLGTTYYWKINEVNEVETTTTWQGDIWNFSTPEYFVVEDFEDYNDYPPDEIWSTWVDGYGVPANGATVGYPAPDWGAGEHYVETAIVHGGSQAMFCCSAGLGQSRRSDIDAVLPRHCGQRRAVVCEGQRL